MIPSGESIRVVHPLFQEEGGGSIPTSPLQLYIGRLHYKTAEGLVREWHSRLPLVAKPERTIHATARNLAGDTLLPQCGGYLWRLTD